MTNNLINNHISRTASLRLRDKRQYLFFACYGVLLLAQWCGCIMRIKLLSFIMRDFLVLKEIRRAVVPVWFSFGVVLLFSCGGGKVISFEGGSVSMREVNEKASSELFRLRRQEHDTKLRIAREIAVKKIIALEAKKKKVNRKTLIETYVEKNFEHPEEKMLRQFYTYNKERFNKPFPSVRDEIYVQVVDYIKSNLKNRYYQELSKNYKLNIVLKAPTTPSVEIDLREEPFWGNPKAKVIVVEYSDFECPYCEKIQSDAQRIRREYKDKIKWVFKDFPLSFHQKARKAHIAVNCANQQKKFSEYQEKIFSAEFDLSIPSLLKAASQVGLNPSQFRECLSDRNGAISKEIDEDIQSGSQNGVGGTPTMFVNGKISPKFRSYDNMKKILDEELRLLGVN